MKPVRILGIETSCDESAVAILEVADGDVRVLHHDVSSQIDLHARYGGVIPELAARNHVPETVALLDEIVPQLDTIDAVAVTRGPGLPTALSVGVEAARAIAALRDIPLVGVHHLEGHIASAWLNDEHREAWEYPMLSLIVSGGHTELMLSKKMCAYTRVGSTRDDAAGEAFDKCAKMMGIPYPGGATIAKLAQHGNAQAFAFPRPMIHDASCDMSFSGLKTAVRVMWQSESNRPVYQRDVLNPLICDVAASLQEAIVDVLVSKTMRAVEKTRVKAVTLVGGVSANVALRERLGTALAERGVKFFPSDKRYMTDNAAMIAAAGYWRFMKGERGKWQSLEMKPEWRLEATS